MQAPIDTSTPDTDSTIPVQGAAVAGETTNPDEMFDILLADALEQETPRSEGQQADNFLEDTEQTDQASVGEDSSPEDTDDETAEADVTADGDEDLESDEYLDQQRDVVSYDDHKDMLMEFDGDHYTGAQLKSMLVRMKGSSKGQSEVEARSVELEKQTQDLTARKAQLDKQSTVTQGDIELREHNSYIDSLKERLVTARKNGDIVDMVDIPLEIDNANKWGEDKRKQVDAAKDDLGAAAFQEQAVKLKKLNPTLSQDQQRLNRLFSYAAQGTDAGDLELVHTNAQVAVWAEKARLHDLAQSKKPKGSNKPPIPKTNGIKTLRTGAKPAGQPKSNSVVSRAARYEAGQAQAGDYEAYQEAQFNKIMKGGA